MLAAGVVLSAALGACTPTVGSAGAEDGTASATPTTDAPTAPAAPSVSSSGPGAETPSPSPSPTADHGPALVSATWGEAEGGRSLAVVPADWVRTAEDFTAVEALWAEIVEAQPEADTPVMYDQLVCHAVGARDKGAWNLEPWRPDVGLVAVLRARCNPT